jgi:HEAT repeats
MKFNHPPHQSFRSLLQCIVLATACSFAAAAQTIELKPQPLLEQCPALKTGTEGDAVAASLASLRSKEAPVRAKAAKELGLVCDSRAVEPLTTALRDPDAAVRIEAVLALGKLGDRSTPEMMIELIPDPDHRVRLALISALGSFKFFYARNMVLNGIAFTSGPDKDNEADLRVRCVAILTCNQLPDNMYSRKAVLFLYNFMQSTTPRTRALAEQTMAELKHTRHGTTEIVGIFKVSNNPIIRRWAAEWIGKLALEPGRIVLEEAVTKDADPTVRRVAAESLAAMKK